MYVIGHEKLGDFGHSFGLIQHRSFWSYELSAVRFYSVTVATDQDRMLK